MVMDYGEVVGPVTSLGWGNKFQQSLDDSIARVLEEHAHRQRLAQGKRIAKLIEKKRVSGTRKEK